MNYKAQMSLAKNNQALREFVDSFQPDFFVTLVFRADLTRKQAEKSLGGFLKKMNHHLFSRNSRNELRVLPVLEMGAARFACQSKNIDYAEGNWHIHLIMEDPTKRESKVSNWDIEELKKSISNLWGETPHGDAAFTTRYNQNHWFKEIYDIEELAGYLYKEVHQNELAAMYLYANNTGKRLKSH